jgi:hypothetical protein
MTWTCPAEPFKQVALEHTTQIQQTISMAAHSVLVLSGAIPVSHITFPCQIHYHLILLFFSSFNSTIQPKQLSETPIPNDPLSKLDYNTLCDYLWLIWISLRMPNYFFIFLLVRNQSY